MADRVIVIPYDPEWARRFAELGRRLRAALGDAALRIDHIGSTAVVGLAAKPIIDVQISVASFEPIDAYRLSLERLGYVFRAENPERTKRYFREPPGERRTHIHVRRAGSWAEQFSLLFRDYLRTHPEDAARYADVKRALARKHGEDRVGYTNAKTPFIWSVMMSADLWSQEVGWTPGPSDA
ncbi:MAG: GrpB family protein [Candidatus Bipolaricaulis sp.]|nr:GrpB family protein [Candidatus Bipolaricaulis sp.]